MKLPIELKSKYLFILSFVVVILVNLLILYRVYDNRTSTPDSVVTLTQRELSLLPYTKPHRDGKYEHNKRRFLNINWRVYNEKGYYYKSPEWLDSDKLKELGFDTDRYIKNDQMIIPRDAYIVLEINSSLHNKDMLSIEKNLADKKEIFKIVSHDVTKKEIEYIQNELNREKNQSSRLYAIDAGLDRYILRNKYPQRDRYIILKGVINAQYSYIKKKKDKLTGYR